MVKSESVDLSSLEFSWAPPTSAFFSSWVLSFAASFSSHQCLYLYLYLDLLYPFSWSLDFLLYFWVWASLQGSVLVSWPLPLFTSNCDPFACVTVKGCGSHGVLIVLFFCWIMTWSLGFSRELLPHLSLRHVCMYYCTKCLYQERRSEEEGETKGICWW